jgi:hypothetical protein
MNEALKAIFDGTEITDEFKTKIQEALDTAVEKRIEIQSVKIQEEAEAKYEAISSEYAEYVVAEAQEKAQEYLDEEVLPMVDKYLNYATGEFMKENKLEIESGTKVELAESFLSGMSGIAEAYNVNVPQGKDDYITEMETKFENLQTRFNSVLDEKVELETKIVDDKKYAIVEAKTKDLTESQKEKFSKVAEKVKFQDETQYEDSINELYESYFPKIDKTDAGKLIESRQQLDGTNDDDVKNMPKTWRNSFLSKI